MGQINGESSVGVIRRNLVIIGFPEYTTTHDGKAAHIQKGEEPTKAD